MKSAVHRKDFMVEPTLLAVNESVVGYASIADEKVVSMKDAASLDALQHALFTSSSFSYNVITTRPALIEIIPVGEFFVYANGDISITGNNFRQFEFLENFYELGNKNDIAAFFLQHSHLLSGIVECYSEIIIRFGQVLPKLELVSDNEMPDWQTIFISIPFNQGKEDAVFSLLDDIIQKWACRQSVEFRRLVTITVQPI